MVDTAFDAKAFIEAADPLLAALASQPEAAKKQATLRRMAIARATGATKTAVFRSKLTGSATSYYGKWTKDPVFAEAQAALFKLVDEHMSAAELLALREALHIQRLAAPAAARKQQQLLGAETTVFFEGEEVAVVSDNATQRIVAKDILNAASEATADKSEASSVSVAVSAESLSAMQVQASEQLEAWQEQRQAAAAVEASAGSDAEEDAADADKSSSSSGSAGGQGQEQQEQEQELA